MNRRVILTAALTLTAVTMAGCGKNKSFDHGTISDGLYRNQFFGFTMEIPAGMYVMPREEMDKAVHTANAGEINGYSELLLFISPIDPVDSDSVFDYNITITAEKIPVSSGVKNNTQYAAQAVKLLEKSTVAGEDGVSVEHTHLGGRDFVKFSTSRVAILQDIYARYHEGYALIIVSSYGDQNDRDSINRILSTIKFEK